MNSNDFFANLTKTSTTTPNGIGVQKDIISAEKELNRLNSLKLKEDEFFKLISITVDKIKDFNFDKLNLKQFNIDFNIKLFNKNTIKLLSETKEKLFKNTSILLKKSTTFAKLSFEKTKEILTDLSKKSISFLSQKVFQGITFSIDVIKKVFSKIGNFITGFIRNSWTKIDGFFNTIFGSAWTTIKNFTSFVMTPFVWIYKVGKKAIEYIWDGVSTIFGTAFSVVSNVISNVASIASKGVGFFFRWWFKTFLNILFNPIYWATVAPFFISFTGLVISGLAQAFTGTFNIIDIIFGGTSKFVSLSYKFITEQLSNFFNWIDNFLSQNSDTYVSIKNFVKNSFSIMYDALINNEYFKSTISWLKDKQQKFLKFASPVISFIIQTKSEVTNLFRDYKGKTLSATFLNFLNGIANELSSFGDKIFSTTLRSAINNVKSLYGFSIEGTNARISEEIKKQKTIQVQGILENALANTNIDEKGAESSDYVIKAKEKLINIGYSEDEANRLVKDSIRIAELHKKDGVGVTSSKTIQLSKEKEIQLKLILEKIRSGELDYNNKTIKDQIDSLISSSYSVYQKRSIEYSKGLSQHLSLTGVSQIEKYLQTQDDLSSIYRKTATQLELSTAGKTKSDQAAEIIMNNWLIPLHNVVVPYIGLDYSPYQMHVNESDNITGVFDKTSDIRKFDSTETVGKQFIQSKNNNTNNYILSLMSGFENLYTNNKPTIKSNMYNDLYSAIYDSNGNFNDKSIINRKMDEFYAKYNSSAYNNDINQFSFSIWKKMNEQLKKEGQFKNFSEGGVIDTSNILKLDEFGKNYAKDKIKIVKQNNIEINNKEKIQKDGINNIIILEEQQNIQEESYELYTMNHISKGIISL